MLYCILYSTISQVKFVNDAIDSARSGSRDPSDEIVAVHLAALDEVILSASGVLAICAWRYSGRISALLIELASKRFTN